MGMKNHAVAVFLFSLLMIVTTALSNGVTIHPNSSMALTSVVVTTTLESNQHLYNSTGYLIEHDDHQYSIFAGFSDMQTVLVSCVSTLLPLIFAVAIAFGIRHAWRKYRHRRDSISDLPWYHGILTRGNTSETLHRSANSATLGIQPATRILSAHDLSDGLGEHELIGDPGLLGGKVLVAGNNEFSCPVDILYNNRNGSIITLKLQNNHLIVESSERLESADDNSFVVEVEPKHMENSINVDTKLRHNCTGNITDQLMLVHRDEIADHSAGNEKVRESGSSNDVVFPLDSESGNAWRLGGINTGLSQSDLSISNYGSFNRGYCYGNQVEYETGQFDHSFAPTIENHNSKWVEFENTSAATEILLNGMEGSDSIANTHNNAKINEIYSPLNPSHFLRREEWTSGNEAADILRLHENQSDNCATPVVLERTMSDDLTDECDVLTCKIPAITGAVLKDETRKTIKLQEEQ